MHVFVLEIAIQIPRHIFIIWCMRRRFSAVLAEVSSPSLPSTNRDLCQQGIINAATGMFVWK
jgi:hypothetical protein